MELTNSDIESFIFHKIGPNVYANDFKDLGGDDYRVSFGVVFPKLIKNYTDGEEEYLRYIKFDNLATYDFEFGKVLKPKSKIDRMDLYSRAYYCLEELSLDTESIVLDATYRYLARISLIKTNLNPIYSILTKIYKNDTANPNEFRINQRKYFDLLTSQELIRKTSKNQYGRGNAFIQIEKLIEKGKEDDTITYVVGFALKKEKKYLIEHLKLTSIVPFLRIANTYYSLALKAKELIHTTSEELLIEHKKIYGTGLGPQFKTKFEMHLDKLIREAQIMEEDHYYYGKENIFNELQEKAHQIKIMSAIGY